MPAALAAMTVAAAIPVSAKTVRIDGGAMSIELDDEIGYEEIVKEDTLASYSYGEGEIDVLRFGADEELPPTKKAVAPEEYACQSVVSTPDETYVVVGATRDADEADELKKAVDSAKVLKRGAKQEKETETEDDGIVFGTKEETLVQFKKVDDAGNESERIERIKNPQTYRTMYVVPEIDLLNVRKGPSSSTAQVGTLARNQQVIVKETIAEGAGKGWCRIAIENGDDAYVYGGYLTTKVPTADDLKERPYVPQTERETVKIDRTGESVMVYDSNGYSYVLSEGTNGRWYDDDDGTWYEEIGGNRWKSRAGVILDEDPNGFLED